TTERGTSTAAENANASGIVSIVVAANVPLTPPIVSSASTVVSGAPAAVTLSATVSPGAIVPASDVNGPPSIEYSPAATAMGASESMPVIDTASDSAGAPSGTRSIAVNVNGSGIVSIVVTVNVPATPPIVTVASRAVAGVPAAVTLTATLSFGRIAPALEVNGAPATEYSPPETAIDVDESKPVIATASDSTVAPSAARSTEGNVKSLGVLSALLTSNVPDTPPIVTVALAVVSSAAGAATRTLKACPGEIVPGRVVKVAPEMEYSPPDIEIEAGESKPVTVIEGDSTTAPSWAPVIGANEKAFGVLSGGGGCDCAPPPPPPPPHAASVAAIKTSPRMRERRSFALIISCCYSD